MDSGRLVYLRNSTMTKGMNSAFDSPQLEKCLLELYNAFFMFHSSLLTVKSVDLEVAHNLIIHIFIAVTLITAVHFE